MEKLQGMQLWGKFQLLGETRSVPNQKLEAEVPGAVWGQGGMKQKNQKCGFFKILILLFFLAFDFIKHIGFSAFQTEITFGDSCPGLI